MEVGRRLQVDISNLVGCRLYNVEGLVFSAVNTSYCIAAGRAVKGRSLAAQVHLYKAGLCSEV